MGWQSLATVKLEQLEVAKELVKGQTDAWFEFCIDSDGHDGINVALL